MRLAKLVLTNVEVANIDAPPANASVATYLDSYRDFPQTDCRDLSVTFGAGRNVDEILKSLKRSTSRKSRSASRNGVIVLTPKVPGKDFVAKSER
jgi:hypothetical protein